MKGFIMRVKAMTDITAKWQRVTAQRAGDYQAGVENPRVDWKTATMAAELNYEAGVQAGIGKKRFGKGVSAAGTEKHKNGCVVKGVARWPAGVAVAGPEFEKGFAPFRSALEGVTLTPRRARRDPANLNRVGQVVAAMVKVAEARGG
ncbi:MAG: hypothetical protein MUP64_10640 [Anaerolineae bacterium]|nr:hypothetical protein [Anaerolineae bacterium]